MRTLDVRSLRWDLAAPVLGVAVAVPVGTTNARGTAGFAVPIVSSDNFRMNDFTWPAMQGAA